MVTTIYIFENLYALLPTPSIIMFTAISSNLKLHSKCNVRFIHSTIHFMITSSSLANKARRGVLLTLILKKRNLQPKTFFQKL